MPKNSLTPPEKSIGDDLHSLGKGVLSCIPGVGGVVAELFEMVITPPLARRREVWMSQVAEALNELRETISGFSWDKLKEDETFLDIFLQAGQIALRNHHAEKIVALKNAVCNSALKINLEETQQLVFLRYIDELTIVHLKLLDLMRDPRQWATENNHKFPDFITSALTNVIYHAFPELKAQEALTELFVNDLQTRGLLQEVNIHGTLTFHGLMAARSTEMGNCFLRYISDPKK